MIRPKKINAFTLLELIVVILIVGILATLGFVQYQAVMEKGRTVEGANALGMLRKLQMAYWQELGAYMATSELAVKASVPTNVLGGYSCSNTDNYFQYRTLSFYLYAYRCASGGKTPNNASGNYYLRLDVRTGAKFSSPAGKW